jgi:hypothetical protein
MFQTLSLRAGRTLDKLNGPWHETGLRIFLLIVLAHWAEHVLQAIQIFVLGWPRPQALGALGLIFPWLVTSEWLHYAYAIVMLIGLLLLRPGFTGRGLLWWNIALGIQFWHHIEHALLLGQRLTGHFLFGAQAPTSIAQLVVPRVELHLLYNVLVFVPMLIGMLYHISPPAGEDPGHVRCTCARRRIPQRATPA